MISEFKRQAILVASRSSVQCDTLENIKFFVQIERLSLMTIVISERRWGGGRSVGICLCREGVVESGSYTCEFLEGWWSICTYILNERWLQGEDADKTFQVSQSSFWCKSESLHKTYSKIFQSLTIISILNNIQTHRLNFETIIKRYERIARFSTIVIWVFQYWAVKLKEYGTTKLLSVNVIVVWYSTL